MQDFGITPEEYALYKGEDGGDPSLPERFVFTGAIVIGLIVATFLIAVNQDAEAVVIVGGLSMIFGYLGVGAVGEAILDRKWTRERDREKDRLLASPVVVQIQQYEETKAAYLHSKEEAERAQEEAERIRREAERVRREAERPLLEAERARRREFREYWMSLSGVEFEQELGEVFKRLGYVVQSTPSTGDQGIDLILRKDGKTTIVQCKGYQSPVGPSVARELFGSLVASKADNAILACTGGFTQGVKQFVRGKRINLLSAAELAKMGESIQYASKDGSKNPPTCPTRGCGEKMILKTGRYGKFWGCPEWPVCNGTRHLRES